jgi:hypothetical protein
VTILSEFSPIGRLLTLGSGLKITGVEQFLLLFIHGTSYVCIDFDKKNWLCLILGGFFTNSSGHQGRCLDFQRQADEKWVPFSTDSCLNRELKPLPRYKNHYLGTKTVT